MSQPLTYSKVSGADVIRAMQAIEKALLNETEQVAMMACFAEAICIASPEIDQEDLKEGVKAASEWLAMFLQETNEPEAPARMN